MLLFPVLSQWYYYYAQCFVHIILSINSIQQINLQQFVGKFALYDSFVLTTHIYVLKTDKPQTVIIMLTEC